MICLLVLIEIPREENKSSLMTKIRKVSITSDFLKKYIFGFAEHEVKGTYELSYKLTLTRNTDKSVLIKENAVNIGKFKFNSIEGYVPHYTHSIPQQAI